MNSEQPGARTPTLSDERQTTGAGEKKRISKDRDVRRGEILGAAAGLFREKGFFATSIEEIVKAVGISHGTFYYHFPSKQAILVTLGQSRVTALRRRMRDWIESESMTSWEKILRLLEQFASMRATRIAIDRTSFGLVREDPEVHNAIVAAALGPLSDDLARLIEIGVRNGEFEVENPRVTALCILVLLADLVHRAGQTDAIIPWGTFSQALEDVVARMLGARQADARSR